jgi:hypothetical protein
MGVASIHSSAKDIIIRSSLKDYLIESIPLIAGASYGELKKSRPILTKQIIHKAGFLRNLASDEFLYTTVPRVQ